MNVRSLIASPGAGATLPAGRSTAVKGVAFDGGYGIASVELSSDGGETWRRAALGPDLGRYSFREWSATWTPASPGSYQLMVRAVNRIGQSQPGDPLWNPSGYSRNVVERLDVRAA